jgi:hypothetical protein
VEHVISESLGNTKHVLPRGVVCDRCNNYFARKIEAPILNSAFIKTLRGRNLLPNKRGRVPFGEGILVEPRLPVDIEFGSRYGTSVHLKDNKALPGLLRFLEASKQGTLVIPYALGVSGKIVARFLAKMALEAMALRLSRELGYQEFVASEKQFDGLRHFARIGDDFEKWPYSSRQIYNEEQLFSSLDEISSYQIMHEWDFLHTNKLELYFVVAIFGTEFAINIGGPEISGFRSWLKENGNKSPLHTGKNTGRDEPA